MPAFTAFLHSACLPLTRQVSARIAVIRVACFSTFVALAFFAGTQAYSQEPQPQPPADAAAAPADPKLPDPGSISGTVVDETGKPVERAAVQPFDGFGMPIHLRTVHTDHSGHFVIYTLHPGDWVLLPSKVEDGYADQTYGLGVVKSYRPIHVTVKSGAETSGVTVPLPPRSATVHIQLTDADTNEPIRMMGLDVQHFEAGRQQMAGSNGWVHIRRVSPTDLLIAPGIVRLTINCAGYDPWTASEENRHFLSLRPGDHRVFEVKLHLASHTPGRFPSPATPAPPPTPPAAQTAPPMPQDTPVAP
jgi:hypothetical protein